MNNEHGVGSVTRQLRCSGNGLRDLVPAYVNNTGYSLCPADKQ
jgi:hypothetical protein